MNDQQPEFGPTTRLSTVIIYTKDMALLASFYERGLDLPPFTEYSADHCGQQVDGIYLGFDRVDEISGQPGGVRLWFTVDNLQKTYDRFLSIGAASEFPPKTSYWGARLAAVRDPDGNVVGLTEEGDSSGA